MIKRIVLWRLKSSAHGNPAEENARLIKQRLEALLGQIPGLRSVEVGVDFGRTEASADVSLYGEFDSRAAVNVYLEHPAHKAVVPFILEACSERRTVEYEV